jgi:hypothetical protein
MPGSQHYNRILIAIVSILAVSLNLRAQTGAQIRLKNRFQVSYEYDDNIREAPASGQGIGASALKLTMNSRATGRAKSIRVGLDYQGGLMSYMQNAFENKLINELSANIALQLKNVTVGTRLDGRLKLFLNEAFDYAAGGVEPFVAFSLGHGFGNEFAANFQRLDYQTFDIYSYTGASLRWSIGKSLTRRMSVRLTNSLLRTRYHLKAIEYIEADNTIAELDYQQEDTGWATKLSFNYTGKVLLTPSYAFHYNNSNSYAHTFTRHQFIFVFGAPVGRQMWLRMYGALQIKDYLETTSDLIELPEFDTERSDSNFFIVDLSRDLNPSLSLLLRVARYNNESIHRNLFYKKTLVTAGADFRF